ncbi:peptidase, M28 family [Formosa agariphila KMM 3901]|uniref:Peptidase, M28 family n=1 Tax=Formosa agariphila (strain DSM 15362 / KCTC 12365 / LMG 23005 / KMM 3901 / M-2Alg 35-1) TaxID=1347342 RepID=T2KRZ5_FORAG|nr:M28 family peptidase [Formosa agariphila]CDF80849.1 peptidase, M28 family [Formosa agariphila KMM 3901]
MNFPFSKMNTLGLSLLCSMLSFTCTYSQTVTDIINAVSLDSLSLTVNEFSGEQPTVVNGNTVTILNRKYNNNDLAAQYLFERLDKLENIEVQYQFIDDNDSKRNVIATQLGTTNPEQIYMICAHYDGVTDYCADDNASGVAALLEVARILSGQCLENTIVYALWDDEEIGLFGSKYYAEQAKANGDNILGVYNIDMIGYDGDNDESFDIDVRKNDEGSKGMSDDIVAVLESYPFKLNANIVIPGTEYSDHASFWNRGYPAVLIGEAWSEDDQNPEYHSSDDRFELFNLEFFHELSKLSAGYMATKAGLVGVDNAVVQTGNSLKAIQESATYQWYNCTTGTAIADATFQTYLPTENGTYKVEITSGFCTEFSDCYEFGTLGLPTFLQSELKLYPNPVQSHLTVERSVAESADFTLYDVSGKLVLNLTSDKETTELQLNDLAKGVYFLSVESANKRGVYKIVKD